MEDRFNEILEYFKGDELATKAFISKYSLNGNETPDEMHRRLAKEFARIEDSFDTEIKPENFNLLSEYGTERARRMYYAGGAEDYFYSLFKNFTYIVPQGSVMAGVGTGEPVSYSNCFVIPSPEDNIESIINTGRDMGQIFKRRGGDGFDLSKIRPAGSAVNNAAKRSTGVPGFMPLYSAITTTIAQEGRRGE